MIPMEKISRIRNTGRAERVQHYGMVRIGLNEKRVLSTDLEGEKE